MRRIRSSGGAVAPAMLSLLVGTAACNRADEPTQTAAPTQAADIVFLHGTVIPMTAPDLTAQALAVKDGRIQKVGRDSEIQALAGASTKVVDLASATLLPGFIDAHGHISHLSALADYANLSPPPVGTVSDLPSLQAELRHHAASHPQGWIVGFGYDDALMQEHHHPTRQELDAVSSDRPIAVIHASGHLGALNTRALAELGMLHPTADPPGGVIRREADGKTASGVLEENALNPVLPKLVPHSPEAALAALEKGQQIYASSGETTAQDGGANPATWKLWQAAMAQNKVFIDVAVLAAMPYPWDELEKLPFNRPYDHHVRVAGLKIWLDGSPQGRTAWMTEPYYTAPEGQPKDYRGYPRYPDNREVLGILTRAADHGWQVFAHVNGDAAIQQYIDAVAAVDQGRAKPLERPVAIHAQTARTDQLRRMKELGIEPTFFGSHTFYWGDWHRDVVFGPQRAARISPQREAFDLGLRPTTHNDSPVAPPDILRSIWSAVTRLTRSNQVLGPDQRVTPYEALEEVTSNAAYEMREDKDKGTLTPGKLADLVILDQNPLTVPPETIDKIEVRSTWKEGRQIYAAESNR